MAFQYTGQHCAEYITEGMTILRDLIPSALLTDLRRETDRIREIARQRNGPQAQRLQPVWNYEGFDLRPFRDFLELPGLRAAVEGMLSTEHHPSERMTGVSTPLATVSALHTVNPKSLV